MTVLLFTLACATLQNLRPESDVQIYADTFFSGCAYLDVNGNGEIDGDDPMISGVAFYVTLPGGGSVRDFTSENDCALAVVPGGLSDEQWPVTATMALPEGTDYTLIGPAEIVLEQSESRADFLFAAPTAVPASTTQPQAVEAEPGETAPADDQPNARGTPSPSVKISTPFISDASLSSSGPWLIFNSEEGIWALNSDGSGLTQLVDHKPYLRIVAVSPRGGRLAFITAEDSSGYQDLKLNILSLQEGNVQPNVQTITPLTTTTTEANPDTPPGDPVYDIYMAVGQSAWSPDGRQLAFISAHDGPSADLYLYSVDEARLSRLTDGPSQAYSPHWSPDGRMIVHMGVHSFGTGAGYDMAGVWAALADSSGVNTLYNPQSGDEIAAGWSTADTLVVYSWRANCGYFNLRAVSVDNGSTMPLWEGCFSNVAFDPVSGAALVIVDQYVAEADANGQQGAFLTKAGMTPELLSTTNSYQAVWSPEANLFFSLGDGQIQAFTTAGEMVELPAAMDNFPVIAPGGHDWAWTGPDSQDLYIGLGEQEPRLVFSGFIFRLTWSPDGQVLFFHGDGALYAAHAREFDPIWITDELELNSNNPVAWVEP
jgi:WD40 repeat protein